MQGRVLIVDDNPADVRQLGGWLREQDYDVRITTSGKHALEIAPVLLPDLVIVDLRLPDIDGLSLCGLLKRAAATADIPIICMSESSGVETRVQSLEQGAIDFVPKPLEKSELLVRVKRQVTVARMRTALKESEAKFRSVMESAIDAIITADTDGIIRTWNKAAEAIFGYNAEEVVGQTLELIIPERFRDEHRAGMKRVTEGGESRVIGSTVEVAANHKDGREIPVELSLATWVLDGERYFTGILRDITERKEAEQKFRSVTESAVDAIISADSQGRILSWNRASERVFGYTAEEAIGRPVELVIPGRFHDAHRAGMKRVTEGGESRVIGSTVEVAAVCRDGREIPVELSLSTWALDKARYYTGIIRDISERKAAETQLKAYAEELARKHEELRAQHEEYQRSQEALIASYRQAARLFSVMTDALPGRVLNGKFRLEEKIAEGGFGVIFAGTQLTLERRVAVKVFRPPTRENENVLFERFRREGLSACRVNHPNAVAVIDSGVSDGGLPYLVLELLEGATVAERLQAIKRFAVPRALEISADVCSVLGAAHGSGIIHRDIKPSNVFLHRPHGARDETVKVLDFGIARLVEQEQQQLDRVTQTGQFVGTPMYMAPERFSADSETGATDVYSVAVMLYELLTGRGPFASDPDIWTTLWMQVHVDPEPLHQIDSTIPTELSELALRALAKTPSTRPTATELEAELRAIGGALADTDTPSSLSSPGDSAGCASGAGTRAIPRTRTEDLPPDENEERDENRQSPGTTQG